MEYFDSEILISEIKKYPCLFNLMSEDYKDRNLKSRAWEKICEEIAQGQWKEMTVEQKKEMGKDVQTKWKSLRDNFTKAWKLDQTTHGKGRAGRKRYIYYKQMAFLIPILQTRQSSGNYDLQAGSPRADMESIPSPSVELKTFLRPRIVNSRKCTEKKRTTDMFKKNILDILSREKKEEDPDKMFLHSLLPNLKRIKPEDKLDIQIEIMQCIKNKLDSYSLTSPMPSQSILSHILIPHTGSPTNNLVPS